MSKTKIWFFVIAVLVIVTALIGTIQIVFTWVGRLPYPPGEDCIPPVPKTCGDVGTSYLPGDLNYDCYVNFKDMAIFGSHWLKCTDPVNLGCIEVILHYIILGIYNHESCSRLHRDKMAQKQKSKILEVVPACR